MSDLRRSDRVTLSRLLVLVGWLAGWSLLVAQSCPSDSVQYVYDDNGRLAAVVDTQPTGSNSPNNAAIYHYDAVGNITAIDRVPATTLTIIGFSPSCAAVGASVTISGIGFSASSGGNTVKFNGTTATVTSQATTKLVVTVPSGATSGQIQVNGLNSSRSFTVGCGGPTITGVSPTSGVPGTNGVPATAVTITGTNFDSSGSNDIIALNDLRADTATASTTQLTTQVPPLASSGRFTVRTPAGFAISPVDFIVPPPGTALSNIELASPARITISGTTTVTVNTAGHVGMVLFDGIGGGRVSIVADTTPGATTFPNWPTFKLYGPDNLEVPIVQESGVFVDAAILPNTGTYAVVVIPQNSQTGHMPFTVYNVPADFTPTATLRQAVSLPFTVPGQDAEVLFAETAAHRVSVTATASSCYASLWAPVPYWPPPAGATYLTAASCGGSMYIAPYTLPSTGTYTLSFDPNNIVTGTTGSASVTIYDVVDVTGPIPADGTATVTGTDTPGQKIYLTFTGAAAQRVAVQGSNYTFPSYFNVLLLKPDTTVLAMCGSCPNIDTTALPVAGTYTVEVDPWARPDLTGSITLRLFTVPVDVMGPITINGSTVQVTIGTTGQNALLTFNGSSGQKVTLHITATTFTGGLDPSVSIRRQDGTTVVVQGNGGSVNNLPQATLPATETYTVKVDPTINATGPTTGTISLQLTSP